MGRNLTLSGMSLLHQWGSPPSGMQEEEDSGSSSTTTSSNSSSPPAVGREVEACGSVSVLFPLGMMLSGLVGNGLAVLLVYGAYQQKENQRKRSFLLCMGSLALTDLVGQLLTSPVVIAVYVGGRDWTGLDPSRRLCAFFGFCMTAFGLCPLFIASAMAVERALAIRAPHWYSGHMKKTRLTKVVLGTVWLSVFAFALLPVLGVGRYALQWPGTWCFISTHDDPEGGGGGHSLTFAATFALLGLFALLLTVLCNLLTILGLVCRCRTSKTSLAQPHRRRWGRITMETLLQLLGIMCVLLACWSPLLVGWTALLLRSRHQHAWSESGWHT